ncbi:MAG: PLP-dependent aminotransferase family protein [Verrucomicrobiota bacterium]
MKRTALSQLGQRITEPPIAWLMKQTLDHPHIISLAAGFTDNPSLPVAETQELAQRVLSKASRGQAALQYGASAGDTQLRELTVKRLQHLDAGKAVAPVAQTIITHGSQQLLYLLSEALFDVGDIVIVEDPTYFVFLGIAQSRGMDCRGVKLTPEGVDLADLERCLETLRKEGSLPKLKALYLVTYHQNPTGYTSQLERKAAALKLLKRYEKAAGHPIYLLEDAAYRELRFTGEDVPSALTCKGSERVIYAGTYSKPFATGIRVGFGILPEELFPVVLRIKGNHDFGTANLLQQLLAEALATGAYEKHLAQLRERYARKAAVMVAAIKKHFPANVQWREPEGGLYVWARTPERVATGMKSAFFRKALAQDVLYVPGELAYSDDAHRPKPNHEMRLSFGGAGEKDITEGIARLGRLLA